MAERTCQGNRSRPVDVVLLVGVGVLLTAFALAIPGA
jgi:hypothetical protein